VAVVVKRINEMKILIFMKNWVGDTFFQFPAIRLIREKYPEAHITCIAPSRCRELLTANPDINDVLEFEGFTAEKIVEKIETKFQENLKRAHA
jgi:ADP-heptose:LPS heptosyltransferase